MARGHFRFMPSQGFRDALPRGARQKAHRTTSICDALPQIEQGLSRGLRDLVDPSDARQLEDPGCSRLRGITIKLALAHRDQPDGLRRPNRRPVIGPDDGLHDMLRKPLGRVGDDRPRGFPAEPASVRHGGEPVIQIQSAGCRAAHPGDTDRGTALRRFHDEVAEAFVTPVLTPQLRRRVRDRAIRRSGPGRVGLQLGIGMQREEEVIIGRCGRAQTQPRRAQYGGHGAVILRCWHAGTLPGCPR